MRSFIIIRSLLIRQLEKDVEHLDEGLDSKTYFETVNVDPPSHYFKNELVIPWLRKVLK